MPVATGAGAGLDDVVVLVGEADDVFEGDELFVGEGFEAAGFVFFEADPGLDVAGPVGFCFLTGGLELLLFVFLPLNRVSLFGLAIDIESL